MLEQMKQHNVALKDHFWEQEKHISNLKAELMQMQDSVRAKQGQHQEAVNAVHKLKLVYADKQQEYQIEKDNENTILRHQCDLKERLKELNAESLRLQHEQNLVSEPHSSDFVIVCS